ncbi:MAG: hypothetical protein Q4A28_03025 [Brachymonas sp.]|nr:hypothetical protein [Brachymonas sp.]
MTNPEFRRNLWLELSPQRLALMVGVLGVIAALTVYLSDNLTKEGGMARALLIVFSALGLLLAGGWGSFTAMASINSEVAERTWDQQRLSALSPWQMAWGKLLGASIYPWLGSLICAAVVLVSGLMLPNGHAPRLILLLLSAIMGCLALHCWIMASFLHTMDAHASNNGSSSIVKRLVGLFVLLQIVPTLLIAIIGLGTYNAKQSLITWWRWQLGLSSLCLLMSGLALALGLLAMWRSMCTQLMVRTTPWAWAVGCTAAGLIVAGFANDPHAAFLWPALVAGVALIATYFALFTEKNNGTTWRAVVFHARQGNWKRMLQTLPLWPVSWLLALLFALLYTGLAESAIHDTFQTQFAPLIHQGRSQILWMFVLRALRDAGIYLFFAWRNTQRKPLGMTLLTYVMLGSVLPLFFTGDHQQWASLFEPMSGAGIEAFINHVEQGATFFRPLAWLAMMAHLAIVGALLVWRWKQSVQLPPESLAAH